MKRLWLVLAILLSVTVVIAGTYNRPNGDTRFRTLSQNRQPLPSAELDNEFNKIKAFLNLSTMGRASAIPAANTIPITQPASRRLADGFMSYSTSTIPSVNVIARTGLSSRRLATGFMSYTSAVTAAPNAYIVSNGSGKIDASWVAAGVNADSVDGFHASQTPGANTVPVATAGGKIDNGWLNAVPQADTLKADGQYRTASATPGANVIPVGDSTNGDITPWIKKIIGVRYDSTLSVPAGSVTISSLDGDTDEIWELIIYGAWDQSVSTETKLQFNNDTGANYTRALSSGTISTAQTHIIQSYVTGGGSAGFAGSTLIFAKSGRYRTVTNSYSASNTSGSIPFYTGGSWINSASNITSVTLSPLSGNFAAGTRIILRRFF